VEAGAGQRERMAQKGSAEGKIKEFSLGSAAAAYPKCCGRV